MNKQLSRKHILLFWLISGFLLFACSSKNPIQIVVTPTPDSSSITVTSVPTVVTSPTETDTITPETPEPSPTFLGSIISPDYTFVPPSPLPPEIPTVTPTPLGPTPIPQPTATTGPSPTPLPLLDSARMGIQLYSNLTYDDFLQVTRIAEPTGVGWVKIQVNWALIQPEGPGTFGERFQLFERQIEAAARPGFKVLLSVAKAPMWARSNHEESGPPDNPQDLADFLTFMLNETKIGQSVDAIEVWNEPNLVREWRGALPFNGAGYMQLFAPSYNAIRAYSPDMIIITAGLAPVGERDGAVEDRSYLQQMYDTGLANYTDIVIGAHPYGWGNPPDARCCNFDVETGWDDSPHFFFLDNLEAVHNIMIQNGHETQQIWATEFGWATWDGIPSEAPETWMGYNSSQDQGNYAIRAFQIAQELPYVGTMFLWNLNFANIVTVEQRDETSAYSIVNPAIFPSERPLYWMLREATGGDE